MILLVGPPGAGKSLQASKLQEECGVTWLSMGKLLRASNQVELKETLQKGNLVNDEIAQRVIFKAIKEVDADKTIVLDGFPRVSSQADWFIDFLTSTERTIEAVLHIVIDESTSLQRLSQRGRSDDSDEIVQHRYQQYRNEILPMIQDFQAKGYDYYEVDGDDSIDAVHAKIVQALTGKIEQCTHA